MVNIDFKLHNATMEVPTNKTFPKEEWLYYVTSPNAKYHIRKYLQDSRYKSIKRGEEEFERL